VDRLEPRFPLEIRGSGLVGRGIVFGLKPAASVNAIACCRAFHNIDIAKIRVRDRKRLLRLLLKPAGGRSKIRVPSPRNTGSKAPYRGSVLA
jgi:hypothetical protein